MANNKRLSEDKVDMLAAAMEDESKQAELCDRDREHLKRLKDIYAYWLDHPMLTDLRVRDYIMTTQGQNKMQAYRDLYLVKLLLGNAPKANKEFMRYRSNYLYEMAAAAAIAGNDSKAKALTKIADGIVKANQLDVPEGEDYPFEEIVPKDYSFSVDPTVIGITPEPDVKTKAMRLLKQYAEEIDADGTD
jgi:hypothetical protein